MAQPWNLPYPVARTPEPKTKKPGAEAPGFPQRLTTLMRKPMTALITSQAIELVTNTQAPITPKPNS